jgi:ADP-ribosylglycohydrolase
MFVAAAIATAPVADHPMDIVETAVTFVPLRSRLHEALRCSIDEVRSATAWMDAYEEIHRRYGRWGHCRIFQELGTLVNTLVFARDVGSGIGLQVSQGNDTDSFGATAGSILGAYHGEDGLDDRWLHHSVMICAPDWRTSRTGRCHRSPTAWRALPTW